MKIILIIVISLMAFRCFSQNILIISFDKAYAKEFSVLCYFENDTRSLLTKHLYKNNVIELHDVCDSMTISINNYIPLELYNCSAIDSDTIRLELYDLQKQIEYDSVFTSLSKKKFLSKKYHNDYRKSYNNDSDKMNSVPASKKITINNKEILCDLHWKDAFNVITGSAKNMNFEQVCYGKEASYFFVFK